MYLNTYAVFGRQEEIIMTNNYGTTEIIEEKRGRNLTLI